jgi:uncharacterized membrane protein YuzA (DUF378 family)
MWYEKLALVLAAIGAINWGLAELEWNAVEGIFGFVGWLPSVIYYVVALCGIYALIKAFK